MRGFIVPTHEKDNSELLTPEWLESVGSDPETMNGNCFLIPCVEGDPVELWMNQEGMVTLVQSNGNDTVVITSKVYKTRREFRLLCQAINLPLKEQVQ